MAPKSRRNKRKKQAADDEFLSLEESGNSTKVGSSDNDTAVSTKPVKSKKAKKKKFLFTS